MRTPRWIGLFLGSWLCLGAVGLVLGFILAVAPSALASSAIEGYPTISAIGGVPTTRTVTAGAGLSSATSFMDSARGALPVRW